MDGAGKQAHLIGIHGAGLRALATVLREQGWRVSGSDLHAQPGEAGIFAGHRAENIPPDTRLTIYSEAILPENCERQASIRRGIETISYPQMLARLAGQKQCVAVAGTHGKSTVVAMAAAIMQEAGLDPTVIGGATPLGAESGGHAGQGPHCLVEACEYRAHFLHLRPQIAAMLGIEPDHFDCFPTDDALHQAFAQFAAQVDAHGLLLSSAACATTQRIVRPLRVRQETFGVGIDADWQAVELIGRGGRFEFGLVRRGRSLGRVSLGVLGRHSVTNAVAAAALAHAAGADVKAILWGLRYFRGLQRRLELKSFHSVPWLDDYAHHPTAVAATLTTARQLAPYGRVWCIFQPHQASRTAILMLDFAKSLQNADRIAIAEIFRAREGAVRPGEVTAADLAAEVRRLGGTVIAGHGELEIRAWMAHAMGRGELTPADIIVTMSAGNLGKLGYALRDWNGTIRSAG